ncbi:MAG TPA: 3-phosphoshikimate 1-carboxyvinyltransferase [Gemmatimonadales bacterium]
MPTPPVTATPPVASPRLVVRGEVRVPGDKSISHRSLMLAALGSGGSVVRGVLQSADIDATAESLRRLGVGVPELGDVMVVRGVGRRGLRRPDRALDCGNSGTTARLMAGIAAGHPFATGFVGDASLSRRPMRRVARPLELMGATFTLGDSGGLPMEVQGGDLRPLHYDSEVASAQVKSAVLLAGLVSGVQVSVTEPAPSRDHTERMLAARGVPVAREGCRVSLTPVAELAPADARVPGDPSSAAFFAAFAALAAGGELRLPDVCLNPTRAGFFHILQRMGADVEMDVREEGGEPVGTVVVRPVGLRGVSVERPEVPAMIDELPLVACLAARAEGETVIRGAEELRVKESDRVAAVVSGLRAVGVEAEELPDGMRIRGTTAALRGTVRTHGDHRLAMAFGVLGAATGGGIQVDDPGCVSVSYPGFWSDLAGAAR